MKEEKKKKIPSYIYRKSNTGYQASPELRMKKKKLQNISTEDGTRFMDSLTQADDADESNDGTEICSHRKPEENKSLGNELILTSTMNFEEVNNHIKKCLEMSSENKITPKNAFALQLIDCMNLLLQKEDFSVMACTLDAGQKIYAHRVDGLHQQVIRLAEEVIINHKKRMTEKEEGGKNSDEILTKETRKANKRNVLATSESLKRTLKTKDPKEKYIKIDGLPGAIMSSIRRNHEDLSFSFENSVQFWYDRGNVKPLTVSGLVTIPHCEIYRDKYESRKNENLLEISPIEENCETIVNDISLISQESDDMILDEIITNDNPVDESDDNKSVVEEVDVISTAMKRLNNEEDENKDIYGVNSRIEAMKMIFNQYSDYHYLNMDKAYYWAGPEFWKRPKANKSYFNEKKKETRKRKGPSTISYIGPVVDNIVTKILKKGPTLNKKTIMGWKMKNVTYARDLKLGVKQFLDLYHMSDFFESVESQAKETEINVLESQADTFQDDPVTDSFESSDPLNSCFYETAPENSSSPEQRDPLNSAFYDAGLSQKPESSVSGKIVKVHFSSTDNEGTSLVPAPKMVHFQPIMYKTRPIRVDMHHLKQTMWTVINENNDKNERDISNEPEEGTKLSCVLEKLPSRLEKRTAEDLSPGMALMALLTLANENNLQLKNSDDYSDVLISLENTN